MGNPLKQLLNISSILQFHLKKENRNVSISNKILWTDKQQLQVKVVEVNKFLVGLCEEKNSSKRIKPQKFYSRNLHLNKASQILSDLFHKEIVKIFN